MPPELFDRVCALTIIRPTVAGSGFFANVQNEQNATEIRDLRMRFEIQKKIDKDPNTCTVIVTNLSAETRAALGEKNLIARLTAGYQGVEQLLYAGDITSAPSKIVGTDWETTIKIKDGGRAFAAARLSRSYKAGATLRAILRDAAASMGMDLPELGGVRGLASTIVISESIDEPSRNVLTRVLAPLGYSWSIQNGELQVLRTSEAREGEAHVISQETGLIGSPSYDAPDKNKDGGRPILTFETLLYPQLVPGAKVEMRSLTASGIHKIKSVRHVGDTHGSDWKSVAECVAL